MGNCLGVQLSFKKLRNDALKCLGGESREKVVIVIEDDVRESIIDVYDTSDCDEAEIVDVSRSEWIRGSGNVNSREQNPYNFSSYMAALVVPVHKNPHNFPSPMNYRPSRLGRDIENNEWRLRWLRLLSVQQKKDEQIKKAMIDECFVPLTEDEEALVDSALSTSCWGGVVSHENSNIDITGEKLQCLKPQEWLNDEVINLYMFLLKEREQREPQKFLKCHFFNTFFYKKLISGTDGYNFQAVRRWTSQRKLRYHLLDCEKIFVPIHRDKHWSLTVINKKHKKFEYIDSLSQRYDDRPQVMSVLTVLSRYYVDEVKDKTGEDIDVSSWKNEFVKNPPRQENGFDCGMFMIKYMDFYSRDIGLYFHQACMPYFRRRTAKEILKLRAE